MRFSHRRGRCWLRPDPGERVLEWTDLDDGMQAVATTTRLVVLTADGPCWDRPWHEINSATWDRDEAALAVRVVEGEGIRLRMPASGGHLPWATTVRERVQASVVTWRTAAVPGVGEVRVAVRQRHDGTLTLQTTVPPDRSVTDPGVSQAVTAVRKQLREELGRSDL